MIVIKELLYYSATFIATLSVIIGVVAYYKKQYRSAIIGISKKVYSASRHPLTTKERFYYIASAVLIVFIFPGNIYLWYKMRQHYTVGELYSFLKIKYIFYAINLSLALLLTFFFYVLNTVVATNSNLERFDQEGFYISSHIKSRMHIIDNFVIRARYSGLSEKKIRQTLSAVKDFEKYIFTYRTPTGHTDQPFVRRYKNVLNRMIGDFKQGYTESGRQPGIDERILQDYNITQDDYTKITTLLHYAPKSIFDQGDGSFYLNEHKIHHWGDEVIKALLGDDIRLLTNRQSLRESLFLAYYYKPLKFFSFIFLFFVTALLVNTLLEKRYFKIIENHFDWILQYDIFDNQPGYSKGNKKNLERGSIVAIVTALLLIVAVVVLNLGNFLDVTKKPVKADVIVALGGGPQRLPKALELYDLGYSKTGQFVLTGSLTFIDLNNSLRHNKKTYLLEHGISEERVIRAENMDNTMMELIYIKAFMLKHRYKSVLIVTDPPHSRRIMLMARFLAGYDDKDFSYSVISSEVEWWDKEHYYNNTHAVEFVLRELIKLPYNFFVYGILQKKELAAPN